MRHMLSDLEDVFYKDANKDIRTLVQWLVRQVDMLIRQRHLQLLEKRPGAVSGFSTNIIYVRMI